MEPRTKGYDPRLLPILGNRALVRRTRDFTQTSPLAFRYVNQELAPYFSEEARIIYMTSVEASIALVMHDRGMCSKRVVQDIISACAELRATEVYRYEYGRKSKHKKYRRKGMHHDVRATVRGICRRIRKHARPFVHACATSCDITDTANSARLRDALLSVVIPTARTTMEHLCRLTIAEADAVQVGRTHRQHASPVTFGFAMAEYVERLGRQLVRLERDAEQLVGKFSGPVGTHAPATLAVRDPLRFERQVVNCMGLNPGKYSTQIVIPDDAAEIYHRCVVLCAILGNLADDMRGLQSTEISEIGEPRGAQEGSSSVMPHKINPITWENMKSLFKEIVGRMVTRYLDLLSDHQRDLTNSASGRFAFEMVELLTASHKAANRILPNVRVDRDRLSYNLDLTGGQIVSDPLNTLLARLGHPDAHVTVGRLSVEARKKLASIYEVASADPELTEFFARMTRGQHSVLREPRRYVGIAPRKARSIARRWQRSLHLSP